MNPLHTDNEYDPFSGESWGSYANSYATGHRMMQNLFQNPVLVEEKVDGSQFQFGVFSAPDTKLGYEIRCRSKGAIIQMDAPEKMFTEAVQTARDLAGDLVLGWTYCAEYLKSSKHNTLAYDRVPAKHLIIFDIRTGQETYLGYEQKAEEAARLGLEVVPRLYHGMITSPEQLKAFLETPSILGGQKIEGVMCKDYTRFTPEKKILIGKYVSEAFKEIHQGEWKKTNPTKSDVVDAIIESLKTPARWNKAIQHLKERGELIGGPQDIGKLIPEVRADIEKECIEYISERLLAAFMPKIQRGVVAGLPEWYKDELLKAAFTGQEAA